jgi:hypothetical protein
MTKPPTKFLPSDEELKDVRTALPQSGSVQQIAAAPMRVVKLAGAFVTFCSLVLLRRGHSAAANPSGAPFVGRGPCQGGAQQGTGARGEQYLDKVPARHTLPASLLPPPGLSGRFLNRCSFPGFSFVPGLLRRAAASCLVRGACPAHQLLFEHRIVRAHHVVLDLGRAFGWNAPHLTDDPLPDQLQRRAAFHPAAKSFYSGKAFSYGVKG